MNPSCIFYISQFQKINIFSFFSLVLFKSLQFHRLHIRLLKIALNEFKDVQLLKTQIKGEGRGVCWIFGKLGMGIESIFNRGSHKLDFIAFISKMCFYCCEVPWPLHTPCAHLWRNSRNRTNHNSTSQHITSNIEHLRS